MVDLVGEFYVRELDGNFGGVCMGVLFVWCVWLVCDVVVVEYVVSVGDCVGDGYDVYVW